MNNHTLTHHGILGQKWGVRRSDTYPLDEKDHSAAEKKAGWKKSLDGKNEDQYDRKDKKPKKEKLSGKIGKTKAVQGLANSKYGQHVQQRAHKAMEKNAKTVNTVMGILSMAGTQALSSYASSYAMSKGREDVAKYISTFGNVLMVGEAVGTIARNVKIHNDYKSTKNQVGKKEPELKKKR